MTPPQPALLLSIGILAGCYTTTHIAYEPRTDLSPEEAVSEIEDLVPKAKKLVESFKLDSYPINRCSANSYALEYSWTGTFHERNRTVVSTKVVTIPYRSIRHVRLAAMGLLSTYHVVQIAYDDDLKSLLGFDTPDEAKRVADAIESLRSRPREGFRARASGPASTPAKSSDGSSLAQELARLKTLFEQGAITQGEYDKARAKLLEGN